MLYHAIGQNIVNVHRFTVKEEMCCCHLCHLIESCMQDASGHHLVRALQIALEDATRQDFHVLKS